MGTMNQMRLAVACALAVMTVAPVEAQVQEIVLHTFALGTGVAPVGVSLAPDGIYGTANRGGTAGYGVVYKLDTSFHYTVLHNFTNADGATPFAGVISDSADNLYGTTENGGTDGYGVVYKVDAAGNYTVLYNFTGGVVDGRNPQAGVIRDSAGNLYGTTPLGGVVAANCSLGCGIVYKIDTNSHETVLYSFTGGADGAYPQAGVILDSAGSLYGTTQNGGTAGHGVVYKLDADGSYTVLHHFSEPIYPNGVILAPDGLYGTTNGGITDGGVVYKLDASAQYTVLHNFTLGGIDGSNPSASVTRDSAGNLYGTTSLGGTAGWGVVYKLDSAGNYTVLYNFTDGADGGLPTAGVIRSPAGNLIGAAEVGGNRYANGGVVFVLTGVQ